MSDPVVRSPRKLIEVALPLDSINAEASLRKRKAPAGYPTGLHKWWAQRPLAAARAVLFAQLVNDPGYQQGGGFKYGRNKKEAAVERKRLFKIIEDLVLWENTANEEVLQRARTEIRRSWREVCELNKDHPRAVELFNPEVLPAFHDPFAGSGAIPLEAQRLGLEAHASDLNPVAVLINKAMIEFPPRFARRAPVGPEIVGKGKSLALSQSWPGATGLAEDVRRYGHWMRAEAETRIGHLVPQVEITPEVAHNRSDLQSLVGKRLTVVAWLWARTVKSPNPAFSNVDVPLASTFMLSNKPGKEAYVEPVIDGSDYLFTVKAGTPKDMEATKRGTSASKWNAFRCLMSNAPIAYEYIRGEGTAGRMGCRLMAVVVEGARGRVYLSPSPSIEARAREAPMSWGPELEINYHPRDIKTQIYGLTQYGHLFTRRQLAVLTTFTDLLAEARDKVRHDALAKGFGDDGQGLDSGGAAATAYAEAVSVYLAFALSRAADYGCSIATWRPKDSAMRSGMAKQALPMTWDFAEGNLFGPSSSGFSECAEVVAKVISASLAPASGAPAGDAAQRNAADSGLTAPVFPSAVISTDPPYYDNIGYADLSDFFYVWLRRSLRSTFPALFATVAVPKAEELVATPYRHDGKEAAEQFFLKGMTRAISNLTGQSHAAFPITIYYAFKQAETKAAGTSSTGWETFLAAVIQAGLSITGTWPVRTEGDNRQMGVGNNALASSIVLVCRRRPDVAPTVSRREFLRELNAALPEALDEMTKGSGDDRSPVAPVDLSQAIIGPGMAVFSKYAAVLEADGSPMSVHTALLLINRFLAEDDFDPDTRFCLRWFEQNGWKEGRFGDADTLSRATGTSVDGVKAAGVVVSGGGIVRLLKWSDYTPDWDPKADTRNPVWETIHHLIRALKRDGEIGAGQLLASVRGQGESVRQLAYRLYTLCERQGWAEDARAYNELITSWTGIESAAGAAPVAKQGNLFEGN